jgi:hypothetical protein
MSKYDKVFELNEDKTKIKTEGKWMNLGSRNPKNLELSILVLDFNKQPETTNLLRSIKQNMRIENYEVVFFSNGEASADKNYEHLLKITHGLPNKVTRVDGVDGRVKSQHTAANSSNTSWYFLVNAKLKVASKFDFNWQPDRLQIPKHYTGSI